MDNDYGRIHRVAFKTVTSILFTAAMLANIGRLFMRFRYQKRLFADDYVLLFGCSSLIAAFTLIIVMFEDIYFDMGLILGPPEVVMRESMSPDFIKRILRFQQLSFSSQVMCWVTIFAVKISFLLFFRQLLDRQMALMTYWKGTVGLVVVSGIFCICSIFISCPHFGVSSIECAQGPGFTRTVVISQLTNALNMLTDLLIVSIPVTLLWSVKIRLRQKIILLTFLCLSVFMFAISLLRTSSATIEGNAGTTVDVQWYMFWHMTEANVAVTVVSLTAFRSLYGIKTLQQEKKNRKRYEPWISSSRKNLFSRRKQRRVDEFGDTILDDNYSLPSIPGATMTGIRTIIGGLTGKSTRALSTHDDLVSVDEAQIVESPGTNKVVNGLETHQFVRSYV